MLIGHLLSNHIHKVGLFEGHDTSLVLGPFIDAHLGDILCTTPLPRWLTSLRGLQVYICGHSAACDLFSHNPYVAGFSAVGGVSPDAHARGDGHFLQRILQGFDLPIDVLPKPELYFSEEEILWAKQERNAWPRGRPVCLTSCGAITDKANVDKVNWPRVAAVLSERYTVVQAVLNELELPGAIVYRDLSLRQFLSLFTVTDYFVGGTSGGSHVAAAVGVPSLIIVWRALQEQLRFPVSGLSAKAMFLYPQHSFIAAEDITQGHFDRAILDSKLSFMERYPDGQSHSLGNYSANPSAISPNRPPQILSGSRGRLFRVRGRIDEHR